jgi:hypothetical protein
MCGETKARFGAEGLSSCLLKGGVPVGPTDAVAVSLEGLYTKKPRTEALTLVHGS